MRRTALSLAALAVALVAGACGTSGPPASAGPTPTPVSTPVTTPAPTTAPPPAAEIVIDGASIAGALGTYVIDGTGSDSPGFPFDTLPGLTITRTDTIEIRFVDGVAIGDAQVEITAADAPAGAPPAAVATETGDAGGTTLTAGPLPAGRWVLVARLFRADGRGDGLTFWAVTVP